MRRVMLEQLTAAATRLRENDDHDTAVFEARKRCKKARAALRLARDAVSEARFRKSSRHVSAASRSLSELRDACVRVQTVELLQDRARGQRQRGALEALKTAMREHHAVAVQRGDGTSPLLSDVAHSLDRVSGRIADWPFGKGSASAVRAGYARIYAVGRDMFRRAYRESGDETFHDWRKRVKDFWYSSRLLQTLWPSAMQVIIEDSHRLARTIGEDHDFSVLEQMIDADRTALPTSADRRAILGLIATERKRLREHAWVLGARLYAEPAKAFHARVRSYWRTRADDRCEMSAREKLG